MIVIAFKGQFIDSLYMYICMYQLILQLHLHNIHKSEAKKTIDELVS